MTKIPPLELVLTEYGDAELRRANSVAWSSADDDDFKERNADELLTESDVPEILRYLIEIELIDEDQADEIEQNSTYIEVSDEDELDEDEDEEADSID